jgi:hypothetical protein
MHSEQAKMPPARTPRLKFTAKEDHVLSHLVDFCRMTKWKDISPYLPGRSVRQCRERWKYYLDPMIKNIAWTEDEDERLMEKFQEYGPKWAKMTVFFTGRTDIDLKNRFHRMERASGKVNAELSRDRASNDPQGSELPARIPPYSLGNPKLWELILSPETFPPLSGIEDMQQEQDLMPPLLSYLAPGRVICNAIEKAPA